jgi:hypothetical protein
MKSPPSEMPTCLRPMLTTGRQHNQRCFNHVSSGWFKGTTMLQGHAAVQEQQGVNKPCHNL